MVAMSEATALANPPAVFRRYVLINLHYWRDYVAANVTDTLALERERDLILKAISFAFKLEDAWPVACDVIENFASFMERRGFWAAWQTILSEALEVARRVEDKAGEVLLSALLARLLQRQSRFEPAIRRYRQTIRLARRIRDRFNEARACSNLGFLYSEQGQWWRAEVLCCHALAIFEELGNQHGQAHTENHLGFLYTQQGLWDRARPHLERACAIWEAMGDDHGLMYGYINLGRLFNEMEQPDEALSWLQKALDHARLMGEETLVGIVYMNIGISHRLKGQQFPLWGVSFKIYIP